MAVAGGMNSNKIEEKKGSIKLRELRYVCNPDKQNNVTEKRKIRSAL